MQPLSNRIVTALFVIIAMTLTGGTAWGIDRDLQYNLPKGRVS